MNDSDNINRIRIALVSVIENYYSKTNINFKLHEYIQEYGNEDISCFFYNDATSKIKIARYSTDNNEWLLGDYKEKVIKQN